MTDWINILLKAFWCGWAAVGFGILFNMPSKNLFALWIGGFIAGLVKFTVLFLSTYDPVILSSFLASFAAGIYSSLISHKQKETPKIFAIPSVIPLIPGVFAYRTMLGVIKLAGNIGDDYSLTLSKTVHNSVITLFTIMAIAIGITIPTRIIQKNFTKSSS